MAIPGIDSRCFEDHLMKKEFPSSTPHRAEELYVTDAIEDDPSVLKAGIFLSRASLFSPLVLSYQSLNGRSGENNFFQSLQDCMKGGWNERVLRDALSTWGTYAGIVGIGQYTLLTHQHAGVLARFDIEYRDAVYEEMQQDVGIFGEQVIGPKRSEAGSEYANYPCFGVGDERTVYVGPPRILNFILQTRAFSGEVPKDLRSFAAEIERHAIKRERLVSKCYQMYHACNGQLSYAAFAKPSDYRSELLRLQGSVFCCNSQLLFLPEGVNRVDDLSKECVILE